MSVTFLARCKLEEVGQLEVIPCTPKVTTSDHNARDLVEYLGLEWDSHRVAAHDLLARCYLRLAEDRVDEAVPTTRVESANGGLMFFWGRPAGFLRERTWDILRVARCALDNGGVVTWS